MMSSNPTTKLYSDSSQSYDSSRTDSGFLSGANLVSEENLSSEDLLTSGQSLSSFDVKLSKNSNHLDSGVDICLQKQFSGLSLQHVCVTDLIQSAKSKHLKTGEFNEKFLSEKTKSEKPSEIVVSQPWELYFQQDEEGDTQLHIAIIQGFVDIVYSLIRMVPHPCFLDILNDIVQSPLHLAVLTNQPDIVRRLVVAGANVESRDRHGNTPLHLACQLGDLESVKFLTEPVSVAEIASAKLLYSGCMHQVPQDFDEKNYDGETCLHLAAYGSHLDVLRHLIWFGANINVRIPGFGTHSNCSHHQSLMMAAVGMSEKAKRLRTKNFYVLRGVCQNQEDKSGRTVLHIAVETLNGNLLKFLLEECTFGINKLKVDTPNYAGYTPYQIARVLDKKVAAKLITRGAKVADDEDYEDDDHPDHNSVEEEMDESDILSDMKNCQHSLEAVKV